MTIINPMATAIGATVDRIGTTGLVAAIPDPVAVLLINADMPWGMVYAPMMAVSMSPKTAPTCMTAACVLLTSFLNGLNISVHVNK